MPQITSVIPLDRTWPTLALKSVDDKSVGSYCHWDCKTQNTSQVSGGLSSGYRVTGCRMQDANIELNPLLLL